MIQISLNSIYLKNQKPKRSPTKSTNSKYARNALARYVCQPF
jgi:hypothetical protein